ncbi:hypothetical protein OHB26_38600 [Nocardia sp. NBC_01503]|uniref:hypothetical protein n=1 Tax=Nocardia sp. NBC_01503 TaxID=2975997 RepID=UPI002E7BE7BB|nr:hypothetical protein [Nocardia sp. NBC_01503]WTL32690.1 hypothetical protein OHB26_38600 [Nocardia sp. NBC_01503]
MKFDDQYFSREHWFSLGVEEGTNKHYLSIPVSSGIVDYEEYYEIDQPTFDRYMQNPSSAVDFAEKCRRQEMDSLLMIPAPTTNRGTAI